MEEASVKTPQINSTKLNHQREAGRKGLEIAR